MKVFNVNEQLVCVVLFIILITVGSFKAMDETLSTEKYFDIPHLKPH